MAEDELTKEELADIDAIVAETIEPVVPPREVKMRVLAAVLNSSLIDRKRIVRAEEGSWTPTPIRGVSIKELAADERRRTVTLLMRLEPRALYPAHDHRGAEESFVVSGSCRIGEVVLSEGDYHRIEARESHGDVISDDGCVLLLIVDEEDYRAA